LRQKIERFQRWIDTHSFSDKRIIVINQSSERLESLQSLLQLYLPDLSSLKRIECYDASNMLFQNSVVSLVVLTDGKIDKSQYRRFKIKNVRANSDFARIEEALTRRFRNRWPNPDLVVIDGGKPQVRMAQKVLDQQDHPPALIGLAKAPDRLVIPKNSGERATLITVNPPSHNPGFNLLKLVRDESHRFANSYRKILERNQNKL
jgi:excinuclease ABC subunit C